MSRIDKVISKLVEARERRFRASIYVDVWVPATEDIERDRGAARGQVDKYQDAIPNSYVGDVAHYEPHSREPFDRVL